MATDTLEIARALAARAVALEADITLRSRFATGVTPRRLRLLLDLGDLAEQLLDALEAET